MSQFKINDVAQAKQKIDVGGNHIISKGEYITITDMNINYFNEHRNLFFRIITL